MHQSLPFRIMIWVGVAVLLVWSLGPVYWTLVSSITPAADFSARPIHFFPQNFTLNHFERLLGINVDRIGGVEVWKQFRSALFNSVVSSLAATVFCVAIAALGGYAFTRLKFPGRRPLFIAVVATIAIPGYAVLIPLYRLMIGLHMVDTFVGITLIYISAFLPLALWLLRSVFESLPIALEEAAQLDGASRLYILFRIVLPLAAPDQAADRLDPRICHQELHRLRPDHRRRVDRHHHPGFGRGVFEPLSDQRFARRLRQVEPASKKTGGVSHGHYRSDHR
jgi:multiple sugar transport system permease protein